MITNSVDRAIHPLILVMIRFVFLGLCILLVACTATDKDSAKGRHSISGNTMGTYFNVTLIADNSVDVAEIRSHIEEQLEKVNRLMSTYLVDSEVSQFNALRSLDELEVSAETAEVITQAICIGEQTQGALDVTVNPLVRLWGFGTDATGFNLPAPEVINDTLRYVGYKKLVINQNMLSKRVDGVELDLSAIAKGYAIDQLADQLYSLGFSDWLLDVGGELRASGRNLDRKWLVAIESPTEEGGVLQVLPLENQAVATSGDYRNYFTANGQRYSHVINPTDGYPVNHDLISVTVLHANAMIADAYATAFLVMGVDQSLKLANKLGLSILLVSKIDHKNATGNALRVNKTGKFNASSHWGLSE